ncbi:MAG: DMT family transporter [Nocardioidaceae bacterium]
MIVAVLLAFACASTFAISTSVQHHATTGSPPPSAGLLSLLGFLVRRPLWLLGQFLATCAFALHAMALHEGQLAVVQPIVVSGIVWAVPARAAMSRRWPSFDEVRAVALTALGLAVFLVASNPTEGRATSGGLVALLLALGGVVAATLSNLVAGMIHEHPRRRAFFLGATAGILFGMVAAFLKMALQAFSNDGLGGVLGSWPTYALLAAGAGGVLTNQRAYQTAGLSASMPVLNIANVVTALTFGLLVFREEPRHSPLLLVIEVAALAAIAFGLLLLVRLEETVLHPHPTLDAVLPQP